MDLLKKLWLRSSSISKMWEDSEYIQRVIQSCKTYEQIMTVEEWLYRVYGQLPMNIQMAIRWQETNIGTTNDNTTTDIGTKRIH